MNCPKNEKSTGVSKTIKPVTQTELTDVKAASISDIAYSPVDETGKTRRIVPTIIKLKKVKIKSRAGWSIRGSNQVRSNVFNCVLFGRRNKF